MNKKIVVVLLATGILASGDLARAQQSQKIPRIGWLAPGFADSSEAENPNAQDFAGV